MSGFTTDPLLGTARVVLIFLIGLLGFVLAGLVIGFGALVTVARAEVVSELASQGAPATAYSIILLCVVLLAGIVALGIKFLLELRGIVLSVDRGDPFEPANADRLSRMGWLMVVVYGLAIGAGVATAWLQRMVPDARDANIDFDLGGGSILLILVLFILARVFRQGAAMRADLEGTV